ncbi:MAG: EAL domain-containing protein, partial [Fretibacterium sp.]|nr:EAL domain-containing protein [Fretibacterium sp.]
MLKLEITESTSGEDQGVLNLGIEKFRHNGYEVWMDDFGSGYSSLGVLKDYNFDAIKFDMGFLSNFSKSKKSRFILRANLSMAKQMGVQSLAEGVETEEQFAYLRNIGFEKAQGYLFGRPMTLDEIFALPRPKEDSRDQAYYDRLSRVELPSQEVFDREGGVSIARVDGVGVYELQGGRFSLLMGNDVYCRWLGAGDIPSAAQMAGRLLNGDTRLRRKVLSLIEDIQGREKGEGDFYAFANGNCVHVRVAFLAGNPRTGASAFAARHTDVTSLPGPAAAGEGSAAHIKQGLGEALGGLIDLSGELPRDEGGHGLPC